MIAKASFTRLPTCPIKLRELARYSTPAIDTTGATFIVIQMSDGQTKAQLLSTGARI